MTEDEIIASGKAAFQAAYGGVIPVPETVPPGSFGELNLKLFHEVWADDRLSQRDKRLAVLGVLAGRGADPSLFAIHARSALRNKELTPEALRTLMRVFCYYAGAPAASALYLALEKLLAETNEGETA
jgi:4-carboxymuconolactone decarboxylase